MKYESPTLSMMGQMEELTGSNGTPNLLGDCFLKCLETAWEGPFPCEGGGVYYIERCVAW